MIKVVIFLLILFNSSQQIDLSRKSRKHRKRLINLNVRKSIHRFDELTSTKEKNKKNRRQLKKRVEKKVEITQPTNIIDKIENLNIYDDPLSICELGQGGSTYIDGKCNEPNGGVHQLCFFKIGTNSNKFSENTYQGSDWSTKREGRNHCICLGAYSLYITRLDEGEIQEDEQMMKKQKLKCDAIPKSVLTTQYVDNWNTWNGNEIPDQIVNGINEFVKQCIKYTKGDKYMLHKFRDNFEQFKLSIPQYSDKLVFKCDKYE